MAIGNVIQRGTTLYIYSERGETIGFITTGDGKLQGDTSGSINVRRGTTIYTYNEKGHLKGTHPA